MDYIRELKGTFLNAQDQWRPALNSKYSPSATAYPTPGVLDVKVLYVKVNGCSNLHEAPEVLYVCFPPRSIVTALEVNGGRIPPSEAASLTLRRDRVTSESIEVTYVSTDHLRLLGCIWFEVNDDHDEEVLVSGKIEPPEGPEGAWSLELINPSSASGCSFVRGGKGDLIGAPCPAVEICIVGSYSGSCLVLSHTLQLPRPRRSSRHLTTTLDAIPEDEENSTLLTKPGSLDHEIQDEGPDMSEEDGAKQSFYVPDGMSYIENDDGEMTWFNAGVRVGVGIGLGMCLGIGIGVGLLIRTYQATTGSFRRRLF